MSYRTTEISFDSEETEASQKLLIVHGFAREGDAWNRCNMWEEDDAIQLWAEVKALYPQAALTITTWPETECCDCWSFPDDE